MRLDEVGYGWIWLEWLAMEGSMDFEGMCVDSTNRKANEPLEDMR